MILFRLVICSATIAYMQILILQSTIQADLESKRKALAAND